MKKIKLTTLDKIYFTPYTKKYGCAGFQICPVMKYGKLKKVFIYPSQQPDKDCYYEIEFNNQDTLSISSWTHKGYTHPNIWLMFWCKEHKCMCYHVHADRKLNCIEFHAMSSADIIFTNKDDD